MDPFVVPQTQYFASVLFWICHLASNDVTLALLRQCAVSNSQHSRAFSTPLHDLNFIFGQYQDSSSQTMHVDDCSPLSDIRDLHGLSTILNGRNLVPGWFYSHSSSKTAEDSRLVGWLVGWGNGVLMEPL